MWESHPEQAEAYRQYLKDHAEEFGLRAEDIAALQSPVLVNMLHVDDATAIPLGQYVAQDTKTEVWNESNRKMPYSVWESKYVRLPTCYSEPRTMKCRLPGLWMPTVQVS